MSTSRPSDDEIGKPLKVDDIRRLKPAPPPAPTEHFRRDLTRLLNFHGVGNGSDTPDFILAEYLLACLAAYDAAVQARERW